MTPFERRLHERFRRKLINETPEVQKQLLDAWDRVVEGIAPAELERLVAEKDIEKVIAEIFPEERLNAAFSELKHGLELKVHGAMEWGAQELPSAAKAVGVFFDVANANHVDAAAELLTKVIDGLKEDVRDVVREAISHGIEVAANPRATARQIRGLIGLSPKQLEEVQNFRAVLESLPRARIPGDLPSAVERYTLRDKRFDGLIRRLSAQGEKLTQEQVDKQIGFYLKARIQDNAETIARTATLESMKLGNRLTWATAVEKGFVPGDRLMRRWSTTLDGRERPEHHEMNGDTVPWDQPYWNGDMYAGESDPWNCRCIDIYFIAAPS